MAEGLGLGLGLGLRLGLGLGLGLVLTPGGEMSVSNHYTDIFVHQCCGS